MYFVGVDPGGTTAVAVMADTGQLDVHIVTRNSFDTDTEALGEIVQRIAALPHDCAIGMEDFLGNGPRNQYNTYTLQVIGAVRGYASFKGVPVFMQTPQERYPYTRTDAARDLYVARYGHAPFAQHPLDAIGHALVLAYNLNRRKGRT